MLTDYQKNLLKESVDAESLLLALGFKVTRANGDDLRAPCKIHGGDNPTGFSMRADSGRWTCFTHHCEQGSSGVDNDVIALVMKVNKCSFSDAIKYLADFSGFHIDKFSSAEEERFVALRDINKYTRRAQRLSPTELKHTVTEEQLQVMISQRDDYFLRQGFSPSTLDYFEVGARFDREGVWRATIPIRDLSGKLVAVSGRRTDGDDEPRYRLDGDFEKNKVLYNFDKALSCSSEFLIIVEGFKACWAVFEAGFPNVVASMGSSLLDTHINIIASTPTMNILLMLDGDEAGLKGMEKALPELDKKFSKVRGVYLPEGEFPDSLSRDVLREIINMYIASL